MVTRLLSASMGSLSYAVLQAVVIRIIARSGTAEDVGLFLLAQAIATPLSLFAGLRLRDQLATATGDDEFVPYLRRLLSVTAVVGALACIGWLIATDTRTATIGIGILVANLAQTFVWACQGTLIRLKEIWHANVLDFCLGVAALASALAGYYLGDGLRTLSMVLAASWSALAIVAVGANLRRDNASSASLQGSLRRDLLMGLGAMGAVGQITTARVGTSMFLGQSSLARIGAGSFLVRAGIPVVNGSIRLLSPALSEAHTAGSHVVRRLERRVIMTVVAGGVLGTATFGFLGYAIGETVIGAIFDSSVAPSASTAAVIVGSAPLLYASMVLAQLLVARRNANAVTAASIAALLVTLLAIRPLSLSWGETGAAAALGLGYLTRVVVAISAILRRPS